MELGRAFTPQTSYVPACSTHFRVILEPDEARWFAHCPLLQSDGAATWGYTPGEALKNILRCGEPVPQDTPGGAPGLRPSPTCGLI